MNRLFQVTVYTGQQLVLEALQRWLHRPCVEPEGQRQRRASIRSLIVLLLKTAATGVLATILDAAIEYRRRQLLAAAEQEPGGSAEEAASRFSLSPLSRAGIAAWKTRLLIAIDEMERQAHQYGIEPTRRFTPLITQDGEKSANGGNGDTATTPEGKLETAAAVAAAAASAVADGGGDADRQAALTATVEQLQQLAKLGGDDVAVERTFEARIDSLLDSILGGETTTPTTPTTLISEGLKASSSASRLATSRSAIIVTTTSAALDAPDSPHSCDSAAGSEQVCQICMDRHVGVQVVGCHHDLCFQCARRLCAAQDHSLPACPFCRQPINGFASYSPSSSSSPVDAAAAVLSTACA